MSIQEQLKSRLKRILETTDLVIVADDTHRWVGGDGFYEVQFSLRNKNDIEQKGRGYDYGIYLHNENGQKDLEDEYSNDNPQVVTIESFMKFMKEKFDCEHALNQIEEELGKESLPQEKEQTREEKALSVCRRIAEIEDLNEVSEGNAWNILNDVIDTAKEITKNQ